MAMRRIDCKSITETLLQDWVDGELDEALSQEVQEHLEGCPACRAEKDALLREAALIQSVLDRTAHSRQPAVLTLPRRRSRVRQTAWLAAAASLVLGISLYICFGGSRDIPSVELDSVEARPGEAVFLALRVKRVDGLCGLQARVRFDSSKVRIAPEFGQLAKGLVEEGQITIASVSADGWREEDGVVLRLPVMVGESVPSDSIIRLEIDAVSLAETKTQTREVRRTGGTIRVL
jgi:anti-sigma factor RsiW